MKLILYAIALFSLASHIRAEIVESVVTVQIKLHMQQTPVINGPSRTENYTTVSLKTSDLIYRIGQANGGKVYAKNARIIRRLVSYEGTFITNEYFYIRENGKPDEPLTGAMALFLSDHLNGTTASSVIKGKIHQTTYTLGTHLRRGHSTVSFYPSGSRLELQMQGVSLQNYRHILSKQFLNSSFLTNTTNFTGSGTFDINPTSPAAQRGFCEGSIKFTGAKVLRSPDS